MTTKEQFSGSKKRLLEKFPRGETARQNSQDPLYLRQPGDPIPLAPSQQQVWLHAQMAAKLQIPANIYYKKANLFL
jgi:hypothetical protein